MMTTQKEFDSINEAVKFYGYLLFNGFMTDFDFSHDDFVRTFTLLLEVREDQRCLLNQSKVGTC